MSESQVPSPRILIYGFEPFRRYRRNVTQDVIAALPERPQWQTAILPVRFEADIFLPLVEKLQPDYILGLGQCPRGAQLRIERRAVNLMCEKKTDAGQTIDPAGPAWLRPNWRIAENSQRRFNYDAGRYVCNYSMYLLSRYALAQDCRYAFLHVPRGFSVKIGVRQIVQLLDAL